MKLLRAVALDPCERGGTILQIPYWEASFSILDMYEIGSWNSASVGWYAGADGNDLSHLSASGGNDEVDSAMDGSKETE